MYEEIKGVEFFNYSSLPSRPRLLKIRVATIILARRRLIEMTVRIHEISLTPCISKQLFATKSGVFFLDFIHSAYPIATKSIYVHVDILISPSSNLII